MRIFGKSSSRSHQPFVENYLQQEFKIDKRLPIDEIPFCVLDCETTGLGKEAEMVSLGAVNVMGKRIEIHHPLDIGFHFSENTSSVLIHGKLSTDEVFALADPVERILAYIKNRVVVGHNISIDIAAINSFFKKKGHHFKLKNRILDTFSLMQRIDPERLQRTVGGNMRLDTLCKEMSIPVENRHTALGDAYLTAQVLLHQLSLLKQRKVITAGSLLR